MSISPTQDAMAKDGPCTEAKDESALAFMRLHTQHWPAWEGECEVRPITFLAP